VFALLALRPNVDLYKGQRYCARSASRASFQPFSEQIDDGREAADAFGDLLFREKLSQLMS
jgi:hypothetical protein